MIELSIYSPNYFFIPIDDSLFKEYSLGFSLGEVFKTKGYSILTAADELVINTKLDKLKLNIKLHLESENSPFKGVKLNQKDKDSEGTYKILSYRAFDNRHFYDSKMTHTPCPNLTKHESIESNYYLSFKLSIADVCNFSHILITKQTSESHLFAGKLTNHCAPLYVYNEDNYYLGFTASVRDNNIFKNIIITKNTPDVNFFTGKSQCYSAPLYIKKENSND